MQRSVSLSKICILDVSNATLISWLEANATLQTTTDQKQVDLTTLPGWASLSTGSHNITIVAKADGYRDSQQSAGVEVTKELQYDYKFENGILQIYKAPYTFTDGTVRIGG